VVKDWHRLLRAVVESLFLEIFKTQLAMACSKQPHFEQRDGLDDLQRSLPASATRIP